ncbi:hypothetical protein B0H12DRAFT_1135062 [Mycena haematopus]|nr:hypothetical protein B0H12DRAFT_1135062 [Mycena haematopus]
MGGSTLLRSLLLSLGLSAVVHAQGLRRAPALYFRQDNNGSSSSSSSGSTSSAATSSSSLTSSSSHTRSSSTQTSSSTLVLSSTSPLSSSTFTTSVSSTSATTAAPQSSSFSSPSSLSLPPSSSSSASASAQTTTSLPKGAIITPQTTPTNTPTTNDDSPNQTDTDTDDQPTSSGGANNVDAASSGFWGNKGEVGATFTVVALVVVGILVGLMMILRRRSAAQNSARDTFFDTKSPMDRAERPPSPGPSMVSLGNEPMDAHATASPNYGIADQYLVDTTDYNVYPPGAAYAPAADPAGEQQYYYGDNTAAPQQHYTDNTNLAPQQPQYYGEQQYSPDHLNPSVAAYYDEGNAYESYNQHYSAADGGNGYNVSPANHRPSLSPHPYSHPSHGLGAPPSFRDQNGRDSYQPSIDSFYGAAGTAR